MIKDLASLSSGYGNAKLPIKNAPVITVIKFIEDQLPKFIDEQGQDIIENEIGLTQRLFIHLQFHLNDKYPFLFDKENIEDESRGNSPKIDLAVYTRKKIIINIQTYFPKNRFFAIEAKRLGLDNPGKREKEYLVGHWEDDSKSTYKESGGIERFKKHIHGKNLLYSGMIGYMQKYDFDHWHSKINGWIEDFIQDPKQSLVPWSEGDKLNYEPTSHQRIAKYTSTNSRFDYSKNMLQIVPISLFHLWIDLQHDEVAGQEN